MLYHALEAKMFIARPLLTAQFSFMKLGNHATRADLGVLGPCHPADKRAGETRTSRHFTDPASLAGFVAGSHGSHKSSRTTSVLL